MTRRKPTRIVVVGSRTFPLDAEVGGQIVDILRSYPQGTTVLTRGSAGFDTFISRACDLIGMPVVVCASFGGPDNFRRDAAMVAEADEVLAFFDPASLHNTNTGTAHVVEKALDQKKPTRAYSAANGHLVYAGSNE
jgi:hypothetical protein